MTALSTAELDRLYQYLAEQITAHRCAPTRTEIRRNFPKLEHHVQAALEALQQQRRIRLMPWRRGIVLADAAQHLQPAGSLAVAAPAARAAPVLTFDRAIDWKRMLKDFRGVAVTRLTAGQIARYYRKRCLETDPRQAECEANVLLCLRFPEVFLERRQRLDLSGFDDRQHPKRGCRSCGAKFRKVKPNQLYCSARCRAREKRHRRQATPHGQLLRSRQNERYRLRHEERERERRRAWRRNHPSEYRAQKEREVTRRSLQGGRPGVAAGAGWAHCARNMRAFPARPAAVAPVMGVTE